MGSRQTSWRVLSGYIGATVIVATVAALVGLLQVFMPGTNLSIVFLIAVLVSALRWGVGESIYAAVLSILAHDFLFVNPVHTFIIASSQDVLDLLAFLMVAVLTGNLTLRIRRQAQDIAQARVLAETERLRTAVLSSVSHDLRTPLASITGAATILKDNLAWHYPMPSYSTTTWQPEATILALRAAGFSALACVQNKPVVTDAFVREDLNGYLAIFRRYGVPVRSNHWALKERHLYERWRSRTAWGRLFARYQEQRGKTDRSP